MAADLNPAAPHILPSFITAPGDTDVLMVVTAVFLLVAVVAFGILFLRLHSLPERIAHKSHKLQFEIVAVLGLIALFTHVHAFWIAALLLALIEIPDVGGWMGRIATAVERIAGVKAAEPAAEVLADKAIDGGAADHEPAAPEKPRSAPASSKEHVHA